ncbi:MAG: amidohydrolase family protein, partial [Clostridiaceae bacterium]|nr:amidohydrolase family protein [Clostridiaceae bacterium]
VPTLSGITAVAEREQRSGSRELGDLIQRRVVEPLKQSIQLAAEQDITIGCGTDTFGDVITEMQLFHACGLSNMACIKTATANAARICGLEANCGTVEPGKLADLVIVGKNPLEDLEHLRLVRKVMKRGMLVDLDWAVQLQSV